VLESLKGLGHGFKSGLWILGALKPGRLVGLNTTRREACMAAKNTLFESLQHVGHVCKLGVHVPIEIL
jgi:hypothetical protein